MAMMTSAFGSNITATGCLEPRSLCLDGDGINPVIALHFGPEFLPVTDLLKELPHISPSFLARRVWPILSEHLGACGVHCARHGFPSYLMCADVAAITEVIQQYRPHTPSEKAR